MTLTSTALITFNIVKKFYFRKSAATSTRKLWFYSGHQNTGHIQILFMRYNINLNLVNTLYRFRKFIFMAWYFYKLCLCM